MPEFNGKIYVGYAKYVQTQYGELCKVWLQDVNELAANMDAKNGIHLNLQERRQPTQGGFTHNVIIDTWQPQNQQQQGGAAPRQQQGYQQQPPPQRGYQQQPPPQGYQQPPQRQAPPPQQQRPPYRQPQQPPPMPQDDGSFGGQQGESQYNGVDDDSEIPF